MKKDIWAITPMPDYLFELIEAPMIEADLSNLEQEFDTIVVPSAENGTKNGTLQRKVAIFSNNTVAKSTDQPAILVQDQLNQMKPSGHDLEQEVAKSAQKESKSETISLDDFERPNLNFTHLATMALNR